jgi:hypothetical protein
MPITSLLQSWIPLFVIQEFGAIVVLLLLLFIIGAIIYAITNKITMKPPTSVNLSQMPLLRPVPIPTKNRSFFMRILVWIYDVRKWELAENWEYQLNPGERIIIPEGFQFDGASIPRVLWAFLNPIGLLLIPGLIHDYGYRYEQLWKIDESSMEPVSYMKGENKTQWDQLFWRVGKQVNGTKIINLLAFLAVYLGGYGAWKNNRKRAEQEPISRPVINREPSKEHRATEQAVLHSSLGSEGQIVTENSRNFNLA